MPIERRAIGEREDWLRWRQEAVTASDIACLFGDVHPYHTAFKLWAEKSGKLEAGGDSKQKRRGRFLEPAILAMLREDYPELVFAPDGHYYSDPDTRIGASPDARVYRPGEDGFGNLQIKTVGHWAFKQHWRDDDTRAVEAPLYVAIQATIEKEMMGAAYSMAAAFATGSDDLYLLEVPTVPQVMEAAKRHVAEFWRRVADDDPYPVNWGKDVATVLALNRDDSGGSADWSLAEDRPELHKLLDEWDRLKDIEASGSAAAKERKIIDAKLIQRMGNASAALLGERTITAKLVKRKEYTVAATQFRQVKVT